MSNISERNMDIRLYAKANGVPLYRIAEATGVSIATLYRNLNKRLSEQERNLLFETITNLHDGQEVKPFRQIIQSQSDEKEAMTKDDFKEMFTRDDPKADIRNIEYWFLIGTYIRIAMSILRTLSTDADCLLVPESITKHMRSYFNRFARMTNSYKSQAKKDLRIETKDDEKEFTEIFSRSYSEQDNAFEQSIKDFVMLSFHKRLDGSHETGNKEKLKNTDKQKEITADEVRRQYQREYRRRNKDKVKQWNQNYWNKKAKELEETT